MAYGWQVFVFVSSFIFVCSELSTEKSQNFYQPYKAEVAAVLESLNSAPLHVYKYKEGVLVNAHKKADIIELTLEVNIDCIDGYPEVPCSKQTLICDAFLRDTPNGEVTVLGDVKCKPKTEIEEIQTIAAVLLEDEVTQGHPKIEQSVSLSNEATSAEVGDHFVAVRRNYVPCLGCPFNLNTNADGVDQLVEIALKHIESEKSNKHVLVKVLKLQQQVVSGVKYILLAEVAPTLCAKDAQFSSESCPIDVDAKILTCQVTYWQKPWISKAKHVINNNCTQNQQFVLPDFTRNNEIDINHNPGGSGPNQNEKSEEMTSSRLADLESQILFSKPVKGKVEPVNNEENQINEYIEPSTLKKNVADELSVIPLNSEPSPIVEETSTVQPTTTFNAEQTETGNVQLDHDFKFVLSPNDSEGTLLKYLIFDDQAQDDPTEATTFPNINTEESLTEKSSESSDVSTSSKLPENSSTESGKEQIEDKLLLIKRSIRQLEKISPEEKGLVKYLADFAATALDNIDDDNQRRLVLQILGAKKLIAEDGTYYHLILRIGVSHCFETKAPEPNANCREKLFEDATKICKVQVFVDTEYTNPRVVKSQCQNIKRDKNDNNKTNYSRYKRQILGGEKDYGKTTPNIQQFVEESLQHLDSLSPHTNRFKVAEIRSVKVQTVAGISYKIKVKIGLSDCKKDEGKTLDTCNLIENFPTRMCEVKVWERLWLHLRETTISCDDTDKEYKFQTLSRRRRSDGFVGGPVSFDKNSPKIKQFIQESVAHLDSESSHANRYKPVEVISATSQVVSGVKYRIKAKISLSECQKSDQRELENCTTSEGSDEKICEISVWERVWLRNRQISIKCEGDDAKHEFEITDPRPKRSIKNLYQLDVFEIQRQNEIREYLEENNAHFSMFTEFVKKHKKTYSSQEEFIRRFRVFSNNMKYVDLLNAYEQGTAIYGPTKFADLTLKEFSGSHGLRTDLRNENEPPFAQAKIPNITLPVEFDWRTKGVVTEVKDQQQCGSCWAFSVTGDVEGQYAIKHGKLLEFSEQELVDCDTEDQGCNGGLMDNAYRQIEKLGGLETEKDYPYDAEDEKCHFNSSLVRVQLSGALNISQNETDMAKWLTKNGPISIAINANAMQFYMGGVSHPFKFLCSPDSLDHGVLIVGYGVHDYPLFNKKLPYWIVKNSWGPSWGEQGYYRVYRGDGTCGLNQTPSSAIVV